MLPGKSAIRSDVTRPKHEPFRGDHLPGLETSVNRLKSADLLIFLTNTYCGLKVTRRMLTRGKK